MGTPALDGDVGGWPRPGEWRRLATRLPVSPSKRISVCRNNRRPPQWASAPNPHRDTPVQEAEGKRDPGQKVRGTDRLRSFLRIRKGRGVRQEMCWHHRSCPELPQPSLAFPEPHSPPGNVSLQKPRDSARLLFRVPLHTAQLPGRKGADMDLEVREEMGASGPRAEKGRWSWAVEEIKTGIGEKKEKKEERRNGRDIERTHKY